MQEDVRESCVEVSRETVADTVLDQRCVGVELHKSGARKIELVDRARGLIWVEAS